MKIIRYKIEVTSGDALSFVHGFAREIDEVYFPDYGLFVNADCAFLELDEKKVGQRLAMVSEDKEEDLDIKQKDMEDFIKTIKQKDDAESLFDKKHVFIKRLLWR